MGFQGAVYFWKNPELSDDILAFLGRIVPEYVSIAGMGKKRKYYMYTLDTHTHTHTYTHTYIYIYAYNLVYGEYALAHTHT
jgi:hypothetical protein